MPLEWISKPNYDPLDRGYVIEHPVLVVVAKVVIIACIATAIAMAHVTGPLAVYARLDVKKNFVLEKYAYQPEQVTMHCESSKNKDNKREYKVRFVFADPFIPEVKSETTSFLNMMLKWPEYSDGSKYALSTLPSSIFPRVRALLADKSSPHSDLFRGDGDDQHSPFLWLRRNADNPSKTCFKFVNCTEEAKTSYTTGAFLAVSFVILTAGCLLYVPFFLMKKHMWLDVADVAVLVLFIVGVHLFVRAKEEKSLADQPHVGIAHAFLATAAVWTWVRTLGHMLTHDPNSASLYVALLTLVFVFVSVGLTMHHLTDESHPWKFTLSVQQIRRSVQESMTAALVEMENVQQQLSKVPRLAIQGAEQVTQLVNRVPPVKVATAARDALQTLQALPLVNTAARLGNLLEQSGNAVANQLRESQTMASLPETPAALTDTWSAFRQSKVQLNLLQPRVQQLAQSVPWAYIMQQAPAESWMGFTASGAAAEGFAAAPNASRVLLTLLQTPLAALALVDDHVDLLRKAAAVTKPGSILVLVELLRAAAVVLTLAPVHVPITTDAWRQLWTQAATDSNAPAMADPAWSPCLAVREVLQDPAVLAAPQVQMFWTALDRALAPNADVAEQLYKAVSVIMPAVDAAQAVPVVSTVLTASATEELGRAVLWHVRQMFTRTLPAYEAVVPKSDDPTLVDQAKTNFLAVANRSLAQRLQIIAMQAQSAALESRMVATWTHLASQAAVTWQTEASQLEAQLQSLIAPLAVDMSTWGSRRRACTGLLITAVVLFAFFVVCNSSWISALATAARLRARHHHRAAGRKVPA